MNANPKKAVERDNGIFMNTRLLHQLMAVPIGLSGAGLLHAQSVVQFSAATYNVTEGTPEAVILVQRTNDLDTVVSVDFATTATGTTTAGADFVDVSTNLTFLANETNKVVAVPILNDAVVEPFETILVTLTNATGGAVLGARSSATVRITDNDPGIQVANYWVREDSGSIAIAVTRGPDGNVAATVDYATVNGTAIAGQDYTATNGTLSFAADERRKLVTIPLLNDTLREIDETFRLSLSAPTGDALGTRRTATVTIEDNDPGVQFTLPQGGWFTSVDHWVYENEGAVQVAVTRGNDRLLDPFTVSFAITDLTATAGADYVPPNGMLEFATGEMLRFITIPIVDDGVAEADKEFRIVLSTPTGGLALGRFTISTVTLCDITEMKPHRFDGVAMLPNGQVSLTLGGGYAPGVGLSNRFEPYYDLYPLEVSTNLVDWTSLGWLFRTNAVDTTVTFADPASGTVPGRRVTSNAASASSGNSRRPWRAVLTQVRTSG